MIREGKDQEGHSGSPKPFHMVADPTYERRSLSQLLNTPCPPYNVILELKSENEFKLKHNMMHVLGAKRHFILSIWNEVICSISNKWWMEF